MIDTYREENEVNEAQAQLRNNAILEREERMAVVEENYVPQVMQDDKGYIVGVELEDEPSETENEVKHHCEVGNSRNCDEQCRKIVWMELEDEPEEVNEVEDYLEDVSDNYQNNEII